jgi:hypothetical protein
MPCYNNKILANNRLNQNPVRELITRRSQVQILSPLPILKASGFFLEPFFIAGTQMETDTSEFTGI